MELWWKNDGRKDVIKYFYNKKNLDGEECLYTCQKNHGNRNKVFHNTCYKKVGF